MAASTSTSMSTRPRRCTVAGSVRAQVHRLTNGATTSAKAGLVMPAVG